ncbi:hypothetical protein FSP39_015239 [Pinctada imbricata]|uniref:Uncharacterized protein n=1 Tax=Pinctada imbricata TaxID=66713 RepID=A0AA88YMQ6_PINIB|nr:hypothetical protein FSP39_015239 [Pinctada imbricata]
MELSSKTYIPNAKKWIQYYDTVIKKKHRPYSKIRYANQHGGSIASTAPNYMVPIEHAQKNSNSQSDMKINLVSPAQQVVEQAKSEITRDLTKRHYKQRKPGKKIIRNQHRKQGSSSVRRQKRKKANQDKTPKRKKTKEGKQGYI